MKKILLSFVLSSSVFIANAQLKVSPNQRYIQTNDGKPFFWLGDTAWELFHRLTREEAETYLKDRASKKFSRITVFKRQCTIGIFGV